MRLFHFLSTVNVLVIFCITTACNEKQATLFTKVEAAESGIQFRNTLTETETQNVLSYAYFYNGGGVAAGDVNNDGLPDIFFTGNMLSCRLYVNEGGFRFRDITSLSGMDKAIGWCTGAAMADVNGDGLLDIYVCRSADPLAVNRRNLLFINKGNLQFAEEAGLYGLADEGYSTQASFFDYDRDGDLDMFLINHSLQQYAQGVSENAMLRKQQQDAFAIKLYRNDDNHFTDVSKAARITSNVLTFGLGIAVADVNNDGWPDAYVSNDFNEPDYLFINNGNGTFSEKLARCMDAASLYSMGSDFADFNNDGLTDLVTLDMLPEDNYMQKMHSGAENFDKFQILFSQGFYNQYSRNMLHKNNGDGTFSEIGQLAGISNTDWSWSALFSDFDNDGNKDLFITNGYAKDNTNMDFIKYQVDRIVKARKGETAATTAELLEKMPSIKMPNYIFQNNGAEGFINKAADWGLTESTVSSGAAYADLDNDGDMDLVVSNINDLACIYRNNAGELYPGRHYLKIKLLGEAKNRWGIGAKVKVYCKSKMYMQELMPVRGFQSSVEPLLQFGLDSSTMVDSVILTWPAGKSQSLLNVKANQSVTMAEKDANEMTAPPSVAASAYFSRAEAGAMQHRENSFNDFTRQVLLPGYLSRQGPCMAKADVNKDGREDIFIGGSKGSAGQLFVQSAGGLLLPSLQPSLANDVYYEDVTATFFDADDDGDTDLYVASGGYEFEEKDEYLQDRLYLNDGKGNFHKSTASLPPLLFSKSCVKAADVDNDGDMDLFLGGRVVPGSYPLSPGSKILKNNGKGIFTDATQEMAPGFDTLGMVTDAAWLDLDNDHLPELVMVGEWMPVKVFINSSGVLKDASGKYVPFASNGWWNKLLAEDFDGDGDKDIIIGNAGLNTQFHVSEKEPFTLHYKDFDGNGSLDPILCYYIQGVSYPANSMDDLADQLPMVKKKFLEYHAYATAKLADVFPAGQLVSAKVLHAEMMQTIYLENKGSAGFSIKKLPVQAQYAPVYAMAAIDINNDGYKDVVMAGNNSWERIKYGRYAANHGFAFLNDGKGNFSYLSQPVSGINTRGDTRSLQTITTPRGQALLFGVNNAPVEGYLLKGKP